MNLAEKAYEELFPDKTPDRKLSVEYSGRFKPYGANVRYTREWIKFSLSRQWETVSEEMQIGIIQSLMVRIFKVKKSTTSMELYSKFLKNLTKFTIPTRTEPDLEESFNRLNRIYFGNFMDRPSLVWGQESFRKLGSYEYANDTIIISTVLKGETELLDYVMYHEMLHKKIQFESKNGRSYHHTREFREKEKQFYLPEADKKLVSFLRKKRLKKTFRWF